MTFLNTFYLPFALLIIPVGLAISAFVAGKLMEDFIGDGQPTSTFLYGACWGSILALAVAATR